MMPHDYPLIKEGLRELYRLEFESQHGPPGNFADINHQVRNLMTVYIGALELEMPDIAAKAQTLLNYFIRRRRLPDP